MIHIEPDAQPVFCRPRAVPYAMRQRVVEELERLQQEGVIEPVEHSDWASPIVKRNGSIRIWGDFKVTVNQVAKRDIYPLPRPEDLFTKLAGGVSFTKSDFS